MSKHQWINPKSAIEKLEEMEFSTLGVFNSAHIGVFWSEAGGPGPWEMHPDEDELLHVLEGEIEIHLLPEDASSAAELISVRSGEFLVVPKGHWHRHNMIKKTKELYLSPKATLHSNEDDPRK